MEITNENPVTLPELPGKPTRKEALAHEVAARIVEHMNRNQPRWLRTMFVGVHHHEVRTDGKIISVAEKLPDESWAYKSGSKVVEAVLEVLSGYTKINTVRISGGENEDIGVFAPG